MITEYKRLDMGYRNCEVCGSSLFSPITSYSDMLHINVNARYLIEANLVVCENCGFV